MFTLITQKSKFFKVKRGQTGEEIEKIFSVPVCGEPFGGQIINTEERYSVYTAKVGETYRSIAQQFGLSEAELADINNSKPVYPTCKLFVPVR